MKVTKFLFFYFVLVAHTGVFAQTESKSSTKNLADVVRDKAQTSPFVLLTPSDLSGLSGKDLQTLTNLIDPCLSGLPISFGQTINGQLTSSDCRLEDNSYADFYFFSGTQGQQVTVNLSSGVFDTYLGLANESGTWVLEDDDGGGGTNSRIVATLPQSGQYVILANSVLPNVFGSYAVSLTGSTACTYSIDPAAADVPGLGGVFNFSVTTQPGCQWGAVSQNSFITVNNNSGNGSGTIGYTVERNTSGSPRTGRIIVGGRTFTINQVSIICSYSLPTTSASIPAAGGTFEFTVNAPEGCGWIAYYNHWWIWTTNDPRYGTTNVVYVVQPNNGADRTGTITVAGNTFTINQAGANCTYSVSPTEINVSPVGLQNGQFTINTQPGCTWSFSGGTNYVYFPDGYGGVGPGVKNFIVWPNNQFATRTWIVQFNGNATTNINFTQPGAPYRTRFDFFGDSKADISVYRPSTNQWILHDSQFESAVYTHQFGVVGDIMTPGDFNGDRYTEIAVFRPSNGTWYLYDRVSNSYTAIQFGSFGDIPAPADFDGDGKTDPAVFRPSTGVWYIKRSSDGSVHIQQFGANGDTAVPADYDGDGKTDIAIYRRSVGEWWVYPSSNGEVFAVQFGTATDKAVQGDYTGDGKTDIAFWRPSSGHWYVLRSENFSYYSFPFGIADDLPAPADYNADGVFDATVFRPSNATWYIQRSNSTVQTRQFGAAGDIPVPGAYVR